MAFGAEDFTNDMGIERLEDASQLAYARSALSIAARAAGVLVFLVRRYTVFPAPVLTAVLTATDVRVTDHGLVDGRAEPRQAVLQVGTAILIDEFGVPAVRCQSGSPLRPPMPVDGPVRYAGGKWETFFPERTIAVPSRGRPS